MNSPKYSKPSVTSMVGIGCIALSEVCLSGCDLFREKTASVADPVAEAQLQQMTDQTLKGETTVFVTDDFPGASFNPELPPTVNPPTVNEEQRQWSLKRSALQEKLERDPFVELSEDDKRLLSNESPPTGN